MNPRVRIKYCGGCNPNYDRAALVKEIKARLMGVVEWSSCDSDPFDLVLAVQGCQTACADLSGFDSHKIWYISSLEDAE